MNVPPPKPDKTAADYLAIAVSPVLIMVLVGSLVFFLADLAYRGPDGGRLRWVLAWFVLGSVLISRISIQLGSERAFTYGLGLGGATALWLMRFVQPPFVGIGLLAVIWWCASKLVWDCTLVDDDEDATGEGLLDAAVARARRTRAGTGENPTQQKQRPGGRLVFSQEAAREARGEAIAAEAVLASRVRPAAGRPAIHPPGVWVVYFSLAALPVFGLGQAFLPAGDERREVAFVELWTYVAAALGLLLTTSFLGLRRYLRQRYMTMPAGIAVNWIALGCVIALGVLLGCMLLPRPDAAYSLNTMAERVGAAQPAASGQAPLPGARGEKQGGAANRASDKGDPATSDDPSAIGERSPDDAVDQVNDSGVEGAGTSPTGAKQTGTSGDRTQADRDSTTVPAERPPPVSPHVLGQWLKWLIYGAFAVAGMILVVRSRHAIMATLQRLWLGFLALFTGRARKAQGTHVRDGRRPGTPGFATFRNPFRDGTASHADTGELLRRTFPALEAWAAEFGNARRPDETPLEFASRLRLALPDLPPDLEPVVADYARFAYANRLPGEELRAGLRRLWSFMDESRAAAVAVA